MTALPFNDRYQKTTPASSTDPQMLDFPIFSDSDIDVYVNGALTTDWTVASTYVDGVATGAIVTIITPVVTSPTIELIGARDPRRDQFLIAAGAQLVAATNADLARRCAEIQELFRDIERAVKAPFGVTLAGSEDKFLYFDNDGNLIAVEGSPAMATRGQHTIWILAGTMTTRITDGATYGNLETSTNKVMVVTLDFDPSNDKFAQFTIQMPKAWNRGTIIFQVVWSHPSTATNFGVVFFLQAVALADDDPLDTAFGTAVKVTDIGGTTDDVYISPESAAVTVAGSPGEEELLVFQVYRDVSDGDDNLAVVARIHGIKIHYTTDADTDN